MKDNRHYFHLTGEKLSLRSFLGPQAGLLSPGQVFTWTISLTSWETLLFLIVHCTCWKHLRQCCIICHSPSVVKTALISHICLVITIHSPLLHVHPNALSYYREALQGTARLLLASLASDSSPLPDDWSMHKIGDQDSRYHSLISEAL